MKVYIAEDEIPARKALVEALEIADPSIEVQGEAGTVQKACEDLHHMKPDLIFLDIQLSDGNSFSLFENVSITCPVIFVTAFDQYLIKALQHNSIDYLLKPLKQDQLERALHKYRQLQQHFNANIGQLLAEIAPPAKILKRLVVKKGLNFFTLKIEEVAYFYSEHKVTFVVSFEGQKFIYDEPLSELENKLSSFFRLNRKYLSNIEAVKSFRTLDKGKLLVELIPSVSEEVIVSQEKASTFKDWLKK
jgi:two-component system LytT family response regulator